MAAEAGGLVAHRDHRLFSGVVRADVFPLPGRLALRVFTTGPGDHRDWGKVDEWAEGIARVLVALPTPATGDTPCPGTNGPAPGTDLLSSATPARQDDSTVTTSSSPEEEPP